MWGQGRGCLYGHMISELCQSTSHSAPGQAPPGLLCIPYPSGQLAVLEFEIENRA
jgi:hypothetical protein